MEMVVITVIVLSVVLLLFLSLSAFFLFLLRYRRKGSYFDSNGCKIHYRVEGEGPPIILIHGYGVNADINWRWNGIIRVLRKHYTVISIDVRGHGLSDKPENADAYGIEMVNDILRLMDHLNIPKAYIMGYSMGGFITLKFVTMYPERVIKAVVGGAGYEKPDGENLKILMELVESLESGKGYYPLTKALEPNRREPPKWKIKL
ncbi:MAG: alpha/beta hydrolase, partial [Candidatus Hydrogenedentes bacterium]|nr:alpha/beta hydrolase [Candidatus Hydrogenedentota bacterium]